MLYFNLFSSCICKFVIICVYLLNLKFCSNCTIILIILQFYNLVKSYLDERYQKVIISYNNGIESNWEKIKQGVPQGSILGPIFFLIYINDLPKLAPTGTKILLYADDIV